MILKYLRKHIGKETTIETKDQGVITGIIRSIDKYFNITVEEPNIRGVKYRMISIRGNQLRSFRL
ncbi:U6 snRNA-associated Sm-like protein LSm2 [Pancytospora epiphaga]|nr:U6 snRNA-associated Sm-like protein LSm2 [Pancytospora epiphaga]